MYQMIGAQPTAPGIPEPPRSCPLMEELRNDLGFVGSRRGEHLLTVEALIPEAGPVTADQFVEWVFLAQGMNPNVDPGRWQPVKRAIRSSFVRHMGAEVVDARRFARR
jgi:hypothetical protein